MGRGSRRNRGLRITRGAGGGLATGPKKNRARSRIALIKNDPDGEGTQQ